MGCKTRLLPLNENQEHMHRNPRAFISGGFTGALKCLYSWFLSVVPLKKLKESTLPTTNLPSSKNAHQSPTLIVSSLKGESNQLTTELCLARNAQRTSMDLSPRRLQTRQNQRPPPFSKRMTK